MFEFIRLPIQRFIIHVVSSFQFMKRDLLDILACPLCKGDLTLEVFEENEKEIITGRLSCPHCKEFYPIEDCIPNMLPPDLRS